MEKITTSTDLSFLDSIFSTDVTIEGGTIFTYLLMFISFLLAKLLSLLFGLLLFVIIKLTSYVVILEIAVRKVFFPLAIADVAVEGIRSIGIRYLKRFVAVYLRIIIMAASFYFSSALAVEDLKEVLTSQFSEGSVSVLFSAGFMFQVYGTAALYDFIALRFTRRTDELAREALGA